MPKKDQADSDIPNLRDILNNKERSPFIFGISSTSLKSEEKEFFKKHKPLGVVLFGKNILNSGSKQEKIEQFKVLVTELKSYGLLIFIDQEGGIVQRINPNNIGQKKYLDCLSFGKMYEEEGEEKATKACYENFKELGIELKNFGIDFTFAPVADLYYGEEGAIRNRAFSNKPEIAASLCKAAIDGIKDGGIGYCIKHAPGHGVVKGVDSHFKLPITEESLEYLLKNDFNVFAELSSLGYASNVMTSHVVYSSIDKDFPATISRKCIDFMKNEMGMKNSVIISDSINMKALHDSQGSGRSSSYKEITRSCFKAGCDVVMEVSGNIAFMEEVLGS
jgi:beta-glucosidase